jgi:ketosteroid isomerase-like protein
MSQENVEIVRKMYEGFARSGPDGMFEFMDPEVDHRAIEGAPDDIGVFGGYDAMRRYYGQWVEMFDDLRAEVEELIEVGDRVVAMLHVTARMKASEAEVDMRLGVVWALRNGKAVSGREYATREQALEAAGPQG